MLLSKSVKLIDLSKIYLYNNAYKQILEYESKAKMSMKNIVKKKAGKTLSADLGPLKTLSLLSKMRKNKDKVKIRGKEFAKVLGAIIELR